ncbi:thrombomodulin-like, partial [Arapaima gigas]
TMGFFGVFIAAVFLQILEGQASFSSACLGQNCYRVFKEKADFQASIEMCKDYKATLMSAKLETSGFVLRQLLLGESGHFWVQHDHCTDVFSQLQGHAWKMCNKTKKLSKCMGKELRCSSQCFSVSSNMDLRERPCQDQADGFICENTVDFDPKEPINGQNNSRRLAKLPVSPFRTRRSYSATKSKTPPLCADATADVFVPTCQMKHGDCMTVSLNQGKQSSSCICPERPNIFCTCNSGFKMKAGRCQDINECLSNPCEHENCTNTPGSYECTCREGFKPKKKNRNQCEMYCEFKECPPYCEQDQCFCPDGFILDENENRKMCVDFSKDANRGSLLTPPFSLLGHLIFSWVFFPTVADIIVRQKLI